MQKVPFVKFNVLEKYEDLIRHGFSTRAGGVSEGPLESLNLGLMVGDEDENVEENYKRFCETVGVNMSNLVTAYQEHTDNVKIINSPGLGLDDPISGVDGFITNRSGIPLMVRFADCQGVLMFDPENSVIAAVHSGWRGCAKNILGKAVKMMVDGFSSDPSKILVGISPSLGPCCAQFSDPFNELPESMHKYISEDNKVDLWQCSIDQLKEIGVLLENLEILEVCTKCNNKKFFSYRGGNKKTGHMGAVIELR